MTTDIDALVAKLDAAEGPDRELDRSVAEVFGYLVEVITVPPGHPVFTEGGGLEFMVKDGKKTGIPLWTASIDATLALMREVLPGAEWGIDTNVDLEGNWKSDAWIACKPRMSSGLHKDPAIALLIALLKAHQAS